MLSTHRPSSWCHSWGTSHEKQKILNAHQDLSMEINNYERGSASTYSCRSLRGSIKKCDWCSRTSSRSNHDASHDPVMNVSIKCRLHHTYSSMTPSPPRSYERGWSSRWVLHQNDGVVAVVMMLSRQGYAEYYRNRKWRRKRSKEREVRQVSW